MGGHPNVAVTGILDHRSVLIRDLLEELRREGHSDLELLRPAHRRIASSVAPVYSLDELQPASVTLAKKAGSCSQRLALLEAIARSAGIPTRVRALWINGEFWYPRFRGIRWLIPRRILLAWPQFCVDGSWLGVENLYGDLENLAVTGSGFTNDGESLFEAVETTAVDFDGTTGGCADGRCDLSGFVIAAEGIYDSRDELFATHGSVGRTLRGRTFNVLCGKRSYA